MVVTISDYSRLTGLMEFASDNTKMPERIKLFYSDLMRAKMLSRDTISGNIITMNSRLILKELSTGREAELTITYPKDSDSMERKISVLSPIGTALLGKQVGDVVSWRIPSGYGRFEILEVTYQPEAMGDFYL